MQQTEFFVGVDVAKATLRCAVHGQAAGQELANDDSAIQAWLAGLPGHAMIAAESTGRYHQLLVQRAHASGRVAFVLNARDVFFYAKALGARGKTDRTDAQIIARYLAEHHRSLRPWVPATALQARLHELLRCRAAVTDKRSALGQALRGVSELDAQAAMMDRHFDELLHEIDTRVAELLEQDRELGLKCAALRTITGIGLLGSALLGALFSRMPFSNADALVAYSGLDPRANDSGAKTGRRRLSKRGSPQLRRQMYLAAFAASHSKALGPLYRSIKAKGFAPTQALVILARKLLRVAWAVWRTGQTFNPELVGGASSCPRT